MVKFGGFVPEVGQEVLIVNHLGAFRITGVDPEARSVNVTVLRSGAAYDGIPWDQLTLLDQALEFFESTLPADSELRIMARQYVDWVRVNRPGPSDAPKE
jgi:predicted type IV restriction endonuclease